MAIDSMPRHLVLRAMQERYGSRPQFLPQPDLDHPGGRREEDKPITTLDAIFIGLGIDPSLRERVHGELQRLGVNRLAVGRCRDILRKIYRETKDLALVRSIGTRFARYVAGKQVKKSRRLRKARVAAPGERRTWADGSVHEKQADGTWKLITAGSKESEEYQAAIAKRADKRWKSMRAVEKSIPRMRKALAADLAKPGLPRDRLAAGALWLVDRKAMRIGSDRYAARKKNPTFGASSLQRKHVQLSKDGVRLAFRGKSGVDWDLTVKDPAFVKLVRDIMASEGSPSDRLFRTNPARLRAYLRKTSGSPDVSPKAFRTYHATRLTAEGLRQAGAASSEAKRKKIVSGVIKSVAAVLHHTPTVCKSSYIHPDVIAAYLSGSPAFSAALAKSEDAEPQAQEGLSEHERWFATLLDAIDKDREGVVEKSLRLVLKSLAVGPPPKHNRKRYPYQGTIQWRGRTILVENKAGSVRRGVGEDGKPWATKMPCPYGEIRGTKGVDGDPLDVFVGPDPGSSDVYVIRQKRPGTKDYDEDKVAIGFTSKAAALRMYRQMYDRPGFIMETVPMPVEEFLAWLDSPGTRGVPVSPMGSETPSFVLQAPDSH